MKERPLDIPAQGATTDRDDETFALAARDGDKYAFAELYRRYVPVFSSYISRRVDGETADLLQEVFSAIYRGLPGYEGPRFFSWAYRICVNRVTDELRKKKRSLPSVADLPELEGGHVNTPEQALIAKRMSIRLSEAVEALPETQRIVFVLARVEGLGYGEISELLAVPVGTVKSRMFGAVKTLVPKGGAQ